MRRNDFEEWDEAKKSGKRKLQMRLGISIDLDPKSEEMKTLSTPYYRPSYRMKRHARNLNTNDRTIKRQLNLPEVVRMAVQNVIDAQ